MRVIAGKARGHQLIAPSGMNTRPVTDKIKEALFSTWQLQIVGSYFLDLFAGSGGMGIEAISRGAEKTVFVEKDYKAVDIIKKNLAACKFTDGYKIYKDDVFCRIERLKSVGEQFDIIYLDPPFTFDSIFLPVMETLSDGKLLRDNGIIVIRTRKEKEIPDDIGSLKKYKFKIYGISGVHFFHDARQNETENVETAKAESSGSMTQGETENNTVIHGTEVSEVKIKITVGEKELIVAMEDNAIT